jgi:hypothetical protein
LSATGTDFHASQGSLLVARVSVGQFKSKNRRQFFSLQVVAKNEEKLVLTSYKQGPSFNGSSRKTPCSTFKKLILSAPGPGLLQGLHTMSLSKSVPKV